MRTSPGIARVWTVALLLIGGCTAAPVRDAAPEFRFRLAADGLPTEGFWKSTPILADVNGDGFLDMVVNPRLGKGPKVFLGNADGKWTDSSQGLAMDLTCGGATRFVDINRDGHIDLVLADHCRGVFVFLGDGKGHWEAVTKQLTSEFSQSPKAKERDPGGFLGAEALVVADVNGDGFLDIVASSSDQGGLTVYLGDGTGRNWKEVKRVGLPSGEEPDPFDVYYGGWAFDLQAYDMNGDGILDLVASYYTGPRVWLGDGKGRFTERSQGLLKTQMGGIYGRLAVGDINGDGRPDLVIANNVNGAELYLQNADGTWKGPIDVMPELKGGAQAVALGDLDGDGKLDVVIGGALSPEINYEWVPHGLWVRWGDGKGDFGARPTTNLPTVGLDVIWGIAVVDVNRNGRPDIVVATGGATGRVPRGAGVGVPASGGTPAARPTADQKSYPAPYIQVWLNEGFVRP